MKNTSIDLSMLTPVERAMFDGTDVLVKGHEDVAIYMRFSSDRQTEQSIEGQLRDAITFCVRESYRIRAVYVDRAISARGSADKRPAFMDMIADSEKKLWKYIVVWKLDRFARNRTDSALYKMKLRKNGVKVVSVTEKISENPEGIILESVLEGMAEFYSAELSQKITRGMRETALKCQNVGGHVPLGYKVEDHKLVVDDAGAAIVREAFDLYNQGKTVACICKLFNDKGYRTAKGSAFNKNSFKVMFRNKRYIGTYKYKDLEVEDGMPAIISKDVFDAVQVRLQKNGEAPARGKAKVDYLLSGKLFCGHCGSKMDGESGKSKTGRIYNYYTCFGRKHLKTCQKKSIRKELIEGWVAEDTMSLLSNEVLEKIADVAVAANEEDILHNSRLPALRKQKEELQKSIKNIVTVVEKGVNSESLLNRLDELERQVRDIDKQITLEEKETFRLDREQVLFWLERFLGGDIEDEDFRRTLFDLLINSVTVWDLPDGRFKITMVYNLTGCESKTVNVPKEFGLEGSCFTIEGIYEPLRVSSQGQLYFTRTR